MSTFVAEIRLHIVALLRLILFFFKDSVKSCTRLEEKKITKARAKRKEIHEIIARNVGGRGGGGGPPPAFLRLIEVRGAIMEKRYETYYKWYN